MRFALDNKRKMNRSGQLDGLLRALELFSATIRLQQTFFTEEHGLIRL